MELKKRSIAKALSYRLLGTMTTGVIVYGFTGKRDFALAAGFLDSTLKLGIYFLHERLWNSIPLWRHQPEQPEYEI